MERPPNLRQMELQRVSTILCRPTSEPTASILGERGTVLTSIRENPTYKKLYIMAGIFCSREGQTIFHTHAVGSQRKAGQFRIEGQCLTVLTSLTDLTALMLSVAAASNIKPKGNGNPCKENERQTKVGLHRTSWEISGVIRERHRLKQWDRRQMLLQFPEKSPEGAFIISLNPTTK